MILNRTIFVGCMTGSGILLETEVIHFNICQFKHDEVITNGAIPFTIWLKISEQTSQSVVPMEPSMKNHLVSLVGDRYPAVKMPLSWQREESLVFMTDNVNYNSSIAFGVKASHHYRTSSDNGFRKANSSLSQISPITLKTNWTIFLVRWT